MKAFYLSAGNFPSPAANTIQVAKMGCAYKRWIDDTSIVALAGVEALFDKNRPDIRRFFGLKRDVPVEYLPLLPEGGATVFDQEYRPPQWFYFLAAQYAAWQQADLVFTRKIETALAAVTLGLPTILETHDPWEYFPWMNGRWNALNCDMLKGIVVVTDGLAQNYVEKGFTRNKIVVEPDGVDLAQYPLNEDREEIRRSLEFDGRFTCVYTGHLHGDRGIENAIAAAAMTPEVQFVFVGGWERDVEHYRNLAANLPNVRFTGFVDHSLVARYQLAADVLLMQYSDRAHHFDRCSPLKLFEYMGAGRPIISTDMPVLKPILRNGENCLLVPPGAERQLSDAVNLLKANEALANSLGQMARKDVEPLDWDQRAHRILTTCLERSF